jgi:hypothetical protein
VCTFILFHDFLRGSSRAKALSRGSICRWKSQLRCLAIALSTKCPTMLYVGRSLRKTFIDVSDDWINSNLADPGGLLKSKPMWRITCGCSATSVFLFLPPWAGRAVFYRKMQR